MSGFTGLLGPKHALRRLPAGWNLIYREAGKLELKEGADANRGVIVLRGLPEVMRDGVYLRGIAASRDGVLQVTGVEDRRVESWGGGTSTAM